VDEASRFLEAADATGGLTAMATRFLTLVLVFFGLGA